MIFRATKYKPCGFGKFDPLTYDHGHHAISEGGFEGGGVALCILCCTLSQRPPDCPLVPPSPCDNSSNSFREKTVLLPGLFPIPAVIRMGAQSWSQVSAKSVKYANQFGNVERNPLSPLPVQNEHKRIPSVAKPYEVGNS